MPSPTKDHFFKHLSYPVGFIFSLSFSQWPCHLQIQRWNKIGTVSYFYHQFHHLTCVCTHPQCLWTTIYKRACVQTHRAQGDSSSCEMLGASVQLTKLPKTQQISNKTMQEASSPFCLWNGEVSVWATCRPPGKLSHKHCIRSWPPEWASRPAEQEQGSSDVPEAS